MNEREKLNKLLEILPDNLISWVYHYLCEYFEISVD